MDGLEYQIEKLHIETGMDYLDCILDFAEKNDLCLYDIADQLHPNMIKNIWYEARKRNLIQGEKITTSMSVLFKK